MKNTLITIAAALALGAAYAGQPGNNGNGHGGCGQGQHTNGCGASSGGGTAGTVNNGGAGGAGGAGGQGGAGGTGVGIGIGLAGATASSRSNASASAAARQAQGQQQGQIQGQGQSQSVKNGGNSSVTVTQDVPRQTASAYAPALAASNGTCLGSASGGVQAPGFGFSAGSTKLDEGCDRRYNAQELARLGYTAAATALMCQDAGVAKAMETAGTPCKAPAKAATAQADEPSDPYIRRRLGLAPVAS